MRKRSRGIPMPNFTSMVDVLFQLLIFMFVVTQMRTNAIDVDLPEVARAERDQGDVAARESALTITVDDQNRIWLDGEKLESVESLRGRLAAKRRPDEAADAQPVRVATDRKAMGGTLVEVMGLLSRSGFPKIEFECVDSHRVDAQRVEAQER